MAKCDLSIELDQPERVYTGGETVTGVVRVRADADVKCKSLEVSSGWKTHGRGNVAQGTAGQVDVFAGEWMAGEQSEYRFELPVADWPPTYHGHYLNVEHCIDARAKIPWGFDPKASAPFLMRPAAGPDGDFSGKQVTEVRGVLGCLIVGAVLAIFLGIGGAVAVATFPFGLIFFAAIFGIGFGLWLFKVFLPKYLLGDIQHSLASETLCPGQPVKGELLIQPRNNVRINGVTVRFEAREQCVSGSGSNRTTHKHVIFEQTENLLGETVLTAGKRHHLPFEFALPEDAPFSLDLDDNDLIWSAHLRVDIPRWPDWTKELKIRVVPNGAADYSGGRPVLAGQAGLKSGPEPALGDRGERGGDAGAEISFAETARHLWSVREDREQIEMLVEAVSGFTMPIEAIVERRLLYSGPEDPHLFQDGYAVWAHYSDPPLPMVLYVPHQLADEFENVGRDLWRGAGTIVGWDAQHERVQLKVEP